MPKGYVDQIDAFHYRGRLIEGHVVRPAAAADERRDPSRERAFWTVTLEDEQFLAFPASPTDTEELVRERIRRWVDEHLTA